MQNNIDPANHPLTRLVLALWKGMVITSEVVTAAALVGMLLGAACAGGCGPVAPDPNGGIRTECAPDGGRTAATSCGPGQYAFCLETADGGVLPAVCCATSVPLAECERRALMQRR